MSNPTYRSLRDVLNVSIGYSPRQMSAGGSFAGEIAGFVVISPAQITMSKLRGASEGSTDIAVTLPVGQYAISGRGLNVVSGDVIALLW